MKKIPEKYLPVGSVVILKGAEKRLMIVGFCTIPQDKEEKMWDYMGCIYPEGLLQSNEICLFDHSQIEEIYHTGLIDDEEKEFKAKLNELAKNIEKNN